MDKYTMMKTTVFGMNCKANIICRALSYHQKKRSLSEYGDKGICGISRSKRLFYVNLLSSGGLNSYLDDIYEQAEDLFFRLVKQFSKNKKV